MAHGRTRTGLRTLYALVRRICQLNGKWSYIIVQVIPENKLVYYTALTVACDDFVNNIDVNAILDDETP